MYTIMKKDILWNLKLIMTHSKSQIATDYVVFQSSL